MKHVTKHIAPVALVLGLCALAAPPAFGQHGGAHTMVLPSDLKWTDVPSLPPGAKIAVIEGPMNQAVPFTIRLKFPKDYQIPAHSHPAIERVTVLSGTFHMGTGDKFDKAKSHALPTGAIAIMQPGTQPLRLDLRRGGRPAQRNRALGHRLRQPGRRSAQEVVLRFQHWIQSAIIPGRREAASPGMTAERVNERRNPPQRYGVEPAVTRVGALPAITKNFAPCSKEFA